MDRSMYVGSYVVEDKPSIEGDMLRFPYGNDGDSISCQGDGGIPKKVLLNGEIISLLK
jgi:hypothetical protein